MPDKTPMLHSSHFAQALASALGIPANCRAFEVRVDLHDVVTVTCELIPPAVGAQASDAIVAEAKRFVLIPRGDAGA